jgi:C1A family cysteine protease
MPQAKRRAKPRRVKRVLNVIPSRGTKQDWQIQHADAAGLLAAAPAVPRSKDLREAWWKIGDQGATGSCVGWATADSLLRWHYVKSGRIKQVDTLSKRFIWMASKETDSYTTQPTSFIETEGTSLKSALDVARKFGAVRDSVLPFASGALFTGDTQTFYALASQLKILTYFNLGTTLGNWKTWLATKGPILTRLDVDTAWDAATDNSGNMDEYDADHTRGGHCVAIVGYKRDRFIVRNSWGTSWGDKGFAYASLNYAQAAFTEAYGIQV